MTTMLSIILAFMLTMGGSPAVSVSPVNSIGPESGVNHDITGKPSLGEFLKIYPVETKPNAGNPRLVLNLSFQYKKSPLIDLNQGFNMNPYNFFDPFGMAIINVFIGDIMNEANAAKLLWKGKKFPYKYPRWEDLKLLAEKNRHNLNIFSLEACLEGRACQWRVWYPFENNIVGKLNANDIINSMDTKKIFEESIYKKIGSKNEKDEIIIKIPLLNFLFPFI